MTKAEIVVQASPTSRTEREDNPQADTPAIGKWYWVKAEDGEGDGEGGDAKRWLGCVVHIGSNYIKLDSPISWSTRLHVDEFWDVCEYEPNHEAVIRGRVEQYQGHVRALMNEVRAITERLAITPGPALPGASETTALALRGGDADMTSYKRALTLAKEKTLPAIFEEIKKANEQLGHWLQAETIVLEAEVAAMEPAITAIKKRIFSVELYAGLVENVEQVREGAPAALTEKIRVFQRRAYMDEECLAQYETGGMDFKSIRAFDRWLARSENMNRILPFERCVVAFQVRRITKERDWASIREFVNVIAETKADKLTFLYVRNGEQLFRLSTEIEFDEKLFPDVERSKLDGKLWAEPFAGRADRLISDNEYQAMVEEENEALRAWEAQPKKDHFRPHRESTRYVAFTRETVYYDDILASVRAQIEKHNRLVLVLQGLLDRSPVLHPHPSWQLWTNGGFAEALELIYDSQLALVAGEKPNFEAYRAKLNETIAVGTHCVGQEDFWEQHEAKKESARMDRTFYGNRSDWRPTHHRPHGNPGPGAIATVTSVRRLARTATFTWKRERMRRQRWGFESAELECSISVPFDALLNVDAYKPGDFKQFFNDPRTREEYLEWAPLLLRAEEFHAGNADGLPKKKTKGHGRK